jgi:hypothetical protein
MPLNPYPQGRRGASGGDGIGEGAQVGCCIASIYVLEVRVRTIQPGANEAPLAPCI